MVTQQSRLYHK